MSEQPIGLKPNKKLLLVSSVMLVLWIGVLVWIYCKWVWPTRENGVQQKVEVTD
ncbi:MAG TPA: hypothetical protein VGG19_01515 [Tepidisphaeraceae bacterium]|jgi:hypothetical protein